MFGRSPINNFNELIDNPQKLVKIISDKQLKVENQPECFVDAIYIPFKNRFSYLNDILKEIKWYNGPIFVLPSTEVDRKLMSGNHFDNVYQLFTQSSSFEKFFFSLKTTKHKFIGNQKLWDLPIKRSYALIHARENGFKKVLFVDDDMRMIKKDQVQKVNLLLNNYSIVGSFIEEFLDTSLLGHLEKLAGEVIYPFLSGSYLYLRPFKIKSFFPNIYNEDWLFMIPYVINKTICSFGRVIQLSKNLFNNCEEIVLQEFGDIVAEGLYKLIEVNDYESRYDLMYWENVIKERKIVFESLKEKIKEKYYIPLINIAIKTNKSIKAKDCLDFILDWEDDNIKWNKHLGG